MNIQEFSSSLITTAEEGKSIINIIIGMNPSGNNVLDALISLYDSYPESVKLNTKAFAPTFFKLFSKYVMKEKHLPYYREFSKIWGPSELAIIKEKYSELLKDEDKQTFKNSLEFSKALSSIVKKGNSELSFNFIENNLDVLEGIIKKSSAKFIENLSKNHCWEHLILSDYDRFKKICNNLKINFIDVLQKEYVDGFYGFKYLVLHSNDENFLKIFKDIECSPNFFVNSNFFKKTVEKESRFQCNILEAIIHLLYENKNKSFSYLLNNYFNEVEYCMSEYAYGRNEKLEALNSSSWKKLFDNMSGGTPYFSKYEIEAYNKKIDHNFKIIDTILLEQELSTNDDLSQRKRLKI
jgi:hypothetical protein